MQQIIYASAAAVPFTEQKLQQLLKIARHNNTKLNVSGILLFIEGSFLQILEGEEEDLEKLYQKISKDKRHDKIVVISRTEITERSFGEWSMGFRTTSWAEVSQLPGFAGLALSSTTLSKLDGTAAKRVLEAFKDGKWRRGAA